VRTGQDQIGYKPSTIKPLDETEVAETRRTNRVRFSSTPALSYPRMNRPRAMETIVAEQNHVGEAK
jgi:hypothetical protein